MQFPVLYFPQIRVYSLNTASETDHTAKVRWFRLLPISCAIRTHGDHRLRRDRTLSSSLQSVLRRIVTAYQLSDVDCDGVWCAAQVLLIGAWPLPEPTWRLRGNWLGLCWRLWFVGKKIVCTVRCYSLEFQGSGHGFGIGCGLDFGQCSLGGLEHGWFGWLSGGLEIFQGGLLEPAPQPPCRGRSAAGLHAVLLE